MTEQEQRFWQDVYSNSIGPMTTRAWEDVKRGSLSRDGLFTFVSSHCTAFADRALHTFRECRLADEKLQKPTEPIGRD